MNAPARSAGPCPRQEWLFAGGWHTQHIEVGSGPAQLIWFPALLDRAATFTRAGIALAAALQGQARVIAIDPPGYGASGAPLNVPLPEFAVLQAWVDAALDQLPGPKLLVGNSSGSVSALAAAHRSDVAGIALVGWCDWRLVGPPPADVLCPRDEVGLQRLLRLGWHSRPQVPQSFLASLLETTSSSAFRRHVESFKREVFGLQLDEYRGPLALICGTSDGVTTPEMVQRLADTRPDATLHWIQACGHYPHRETPLALVDVLKDWAQRALRNHQIEAAAVVRARQPLVLADHPSLNQRSKTAAPITGVALPEFDARSNQTTM